MYKLGAVTPAFWVLETEKEIQNPLFVYLALIVEVKHFWLKTDQPKNLTR